MFPKTWIIFALCFARYATCSQMNISECDAAGEEYDGVLDSFSLVLDNIAKIFEIIPDHNLTRYPTASIDPAQAQSAVQDLYMHLNMSASATENVMNRCSPTSEHCQNYVDGSDSSRGLTLTADVLWALAKYFVNIHAEEHVQHAQILGSCWMLISGRPFEAISEAGQQETRRIYHVTRSELKASSENATASCGFTCGRKCACRTMQIAVPLYADQPNYEAPVLEVCGQKQRDLAQELQKRILKELNCSEFGDYIREWGWLKVNYQANQTTQALHH